MRILVDAFKDPPKGWIVVRDWDGLRMLLDTVELKTVEIVSFSYDLGNEDLQSLDGYDCALLLAERAAGKKLPECVVHTREPGTEKIIEVIDHYNASYGYPSRCAKISSIKF